MRFETKIKKMKKIHQIAYTVLLRSKNNNIQGLIQQKCYYNVVVFKLVERSKSVVVVRKNNEMKR